MYKYLYFSSGLSNSTLARVNPGFPLKTAEAELIPGTGNKSFSSPSWQSNEGERL